MAARPVPENGAGCHRPGDARRHVAVDPRPRAPAGLRRSCAGRARPRRTPHAGTDERSPDRCPAIARSARPPRHRGRFDEARRESRRRRVAAAGGGCRARRRRSRSRDDRAESAGRADARRPADVERLAGGTGGRADGAADDAGGGDGGQTGPPGSPRPNRPRRRARRSGAPGRPFRGIGGRGIRQELVRISAARPERARHAGPDRKQLSHPYNRSNGHAPLLEPEPGRAGDGAGRTAGSRSALHGAAAGRARGNRLGAGARARGATGGGDLFDEPCGSSRDRTWT